jgi:SsrA-binding protein
MATLAYNKRAKYDYFLEDTYEAGMVLSGGEVKSIRAGRVSLADSFVRIKDDEAFLMNAHINPYNFADNRSYDPRRERKLLLHRKQIEQLRLKTGGKSITIVPVSMYEKNNTIKLQIAIGRGKKQFDKRAAIKKRELDAKARQIVREYKK